jgi:hypothetical protein
LLPASLPAGQYDLTVTNPGGAAHTLAGAFTVVDATAEGVFAGPQDLFSDPAPPRATEAANLALHVQRLGGSGELNNIEVNFYQGDPDRGGTLIGTGTIATLPPVGTATTSSVPWTPDYAMDTPIYAVLGGSGVKVKRVIEVQPSSSDPNAPVVHSVLINGGSSSQDSAGRAVTVQVNASDVGSGLHTMWVAEWMWDPGLGRWRVVQESGWIPFQASLAWNLSGPPGSRFIDAWVADQTGNISAEAGQAHINLMFDSMWVAQGQAQTFNYDLVTGQQVSAQLTPGSGDPDLYVGTYDAGILYASYNAGSTVETLNFNAPATDWYSFIAYGYTNAMYNLAINRGAAGLSAPAGLPKAPPPFNLPPGGPPTQQGLPAAPVGQTIHEVYLPLLQR